MVADDLVERLKNVVVAVKEKRPDVKVEGGDYCTFSESWWNGEFETSLERAVLCVRWGTSIRGSRKTLRSTS